VDVVRLQIESYQRREVKWERQPALSTAIGRSSDGRCSR
jgi:hypothetical protein